MTMVRLLFGIEGRIPRYQFWAITLSTWFMMVLASVGLTPTESGLRGVTAEVVTIGASVLFIACIWMNICARAKRYHDLNKSGWYQLVFLIPVVGNIWLLIELGCFRGTPGENEFGPSPDIPTAAAEIFS